MSARRRVLAVLGGLGPSLLGGAFFFGALGPATDRAAGPLGSMVLGALMGAAVVGLIRLFRVAPWGYPVAGVLCGPIPLVLLLAGKAKEGELFGVWLLGAVFGLLIGLLEAARVRRSADAHEG